MGFDRRLGLRTAGWVAGLAIATATGLGAQTLPSQLRMTEADARESFLGSIVAGYPQWGAAGAAFVALPAAARVAVVQGGFAWARAYVKSPLFRAAYDDARQAAKPAPPGAEGTVEDELKRQLDEQRKSLEESRKALAALPPEQRRELEALARQTEAQLKDPQFLTMMRSGIEAERTGRAESYRTNLQQWEEDWPARPETLVAGRLEAFLTECSDVDFSARLQPRGHKMVFVNPDYEQKPAAWKTCYRAGPEAVGAARTAAATWLKELAPSR
jgi:hypothetical protein